MKAAIRVLALVLALGVLLSMGAAAEEQAWSEEYYRIIDYTEELSLEEVDSLDRDCIELIRTYKVDMGLMVISEAALGGESMEQFAREVYEGCAFGYGSGRDGFMAAYNADTGEMCLLCFGNAAQRIDGDYRDFILSSAPGYREEYGVFGVVYAVIRYASDYLAEHGAASGPQKLPAAKNGRGATPGKPDWYPNDPANFEKYHDPDAPRVVDAADIFTSAEEAAMETRLGEIRAELGKDIVIFTDVSSYDLGHAVYSADFYDFNGYGIGDEFEGACLFVCMDPADRGFWTVCTGPETRTLYTQSYANQLDDRLVGYMAAGDYGEGVADWIENFRNLCRTGMPFPPEWLPEGGFTRTHDASAPRVVDDLDLLTPEEEGELTRQAKAISDKFGIDMVVLVTKNDTSLFSPDYMELYYAFKGYGFGDDYDGIVMMLLGDRNYFYVRGYGKGDEKLTTVNIIRLETKCEDAVRKEGAYDALQVGLKNITHMLKTGRVTQPLTYWLRICLLGVAVGSVFGLIALAVAKKKMSTVRLKTSAADYLVRDKVRLDRVLDQYLSTSTSKQYSPVQRSSGGGSGGGSSYSGSYSGSSGTSHSGSGRSF